jgi:hypothetical protein
MPNELERAGSGESATVEVQANPPARGPRAGPGRIAGRKSRRRRISPRATSEVAIPNEPEEPQKCLRIGRRNSPARAATARNALAGIDGNLDRLMIVNREVL